MCHNNTLNSTLTEFWRISAKVSKLKINKKNTCIVRVCVKNKKEKRITPHKY